MFFAAICPWRTRRYSRCAKASCVIQRGEVPQRKYVDRRSRVGLQTTGCQQRTRRVQSEPVGTNGRAVLRRLTRVSFHPAEASVLFPRQGLERKPTPGSLLPAVEAPGGAEVADSLQESPVKTEKCKWKREMCKHVFGLRCSEAVLEIYSRHSFWRKQTSHYLLGIRLFVLFCLCLHLTALILPEQTIMAVCNLKT